jgi:urease accessory protein
MKLSLNTDFTNLPRAGTLIRAADLPPGDKRIIPFDLAVLGHDERQIRRRVIELVHGDKILVDLTEQILLEQQDVLVLDDGRHVEIIAAEEPVYEVLARDAGHLAELAWRLGGAHIDAEFQPNRILVEPNPAIRDALIALGATVNEISEPFDPLHGGGHHHHDHGHGHHDHGHGHGEPDKFGRMPGDPHYGHNHA